MQATKRRRQFSLRNLFCITLIISGCLAFPEFSFFVPLAVAFLLIPLSIVSVIWVFAFLLEDNPKPNAKAAKSNVVALAAVLAGLMVYGIYGYFFVDMKLG